jgi:adenylate cyclase class 2
MQTEFEIKVLEIVPDDVRGKLKRLGAEFRGKLNFKRYVYDLPGKGENEWLRLRTDGKNTTLTYKNARADKIDGVDEIEAKVEDFDKVKQLLSAAGLQEKGYQENSRELYVLNGTEVSIETWPGIPPYVEIEGQSQASVEEALKKLDLKGNKTTSRSVAYVYEYFGVDMN